VGTPEEGAPLQLSRQPGEGFAGDRIGQPENTWARAPSRNVTSSPNGPVTSSHTPFRDWGTSRTTLYSSASGKVKSMSMELPPPCIITAKGRVRAGSTLCGT
jgi:hypothetical protein